MHFSKKHFGKWVLAGEHTVLRGGSALTMPHSDYFLEIVAIPQQKEQGFKVIPEEISELIHLLLGKLCQFPSARFRYPSELPSVTLQLHGNIPQGAGFGSSAALCVALTEWVASWGGLKVESLFEAAKLLEDTFHGKSSGMDVAAVIAHEPIIYSPCERISVVPLSIRRLPKFSFHDTGIRSETREVVQLVQKIAEKNPEIDAQMKQACLLAKDGLLLYQDEAKESQALEILAESMKLAQDCFLQWGLIPDRARVLIDQLYNKGARAVKMTGSGGGGFLVAI